MVAGPSPGLGLTATGQWRISQADLPRLIIVALAGMFGSAWFTMQGFARVAAGLGAVIQMVEPIIIAFLAGVLDHITSDERLLLAFATENDIDPEAVMRARDVLAGPDWERETP